MPLGGVGLALLFGLAVLWGMLVLCEDRRHDPRGPVDQVVRGVARYLLAGSVAFACIYVVLPGYAWNGYLSRYAPLPVFVTDVWLALVLYVLITLMTDPTPYPVRDLRSSWPSGVDEVADLTPPRHRWRGPLLRATSSVLLVFMALYWMGLQAGYATRIPPSGLLFMRHLSRPEFKHASFVSDNYALPIAYFTEQWAYQDQTIPSNVPTAGLEDPGLYISGKYLWFADRDTNASYFHPHYYLCRFNPTWDTVEALMALPPGGRLDNCSAQPLVHAAARGVRVPFANTLVAQDAGPGDMWAIVRLDHKIRLVPKD
jgi:hypothetical protein